VLVCIQTHTLSKQIKRFPEKDLSDLCNNLQQIKLKKSTKLMLISTNKLQGIEYRNINSITYMYMYAHAHSRRGNPHTKYLTCGFSFMVMAPAEAGLLPSTLPPPALRPPKLILTFEPTDSNFCSSSLLDILTVCGGGSNFVSLVETSCDVTSLHL
jgi:hypothetical protein